MSSTAPAPTLVPARDEVDPRFTWDLSSIFPDWSAWEEHYKIIDRRVEAFKQFEGTLAEGPHRLLAALAEQDETGQLAYKVWYFASLTYDQDLKLAAETPDKPAGRGAKKPAAAKATAAKAPAAKKPAAKKATKKG